MIGLILGVYAALALRDFVYGDGPVLWGVLWKAETDWLPFLTLVTVLVFWQAGLYAERERRAGFGRVVGSLALIGVITLIFALGTGHRFSTYGLAPTAIVLSAICIGLLRGSYDILTRDVLKLAGVRRRAILVGEGENLVRLHKTLGAGSRRDRLRLRRRGWTVSDRRRRPAHARAARGAARGARASTTSTS